MDYEAAIRIVGCHSGAKLIDATTGPRASKCFQRKIGAEATGQLDLEQWEKLKAESGITGELDELGVSDGMRWLMRDAAGSVSEPRAYSGPLSAGTEVGDLLVPIYRGEFRKIPKERRYEVQALLAALLMNHAMMVRDFGEECLFPGDKSLRFTLDEPSNLYLGDNSRNVYEQDFWIPGQYESVAAAAFVAHGVTPGISTMNDMGRVARREDCGSLRLALLRENLARYLAGLSPARIENIEDRYGAVSEAQSASAPASEVIGDWTGFVYACFENRAPVSSLPSSETAYYCACMERQIRSAGLGEIHKIFVENWNRGAERYWNEPVLNPVGRICANQRYDIDAAHAEETLSAAGIR